MPFFFISMSVHEDPFQSVSAVVGKEHYNKRYIYLLSILFSQQSFVVTLEYPLKGKEKARASSTSQKSHSSAICLLFWLVPAPGFAKQMALGVVLHLGV